MRLITPADLFVIISMIYIVLVDGLSESLIFSNLVGIRWANYSSYSDVHLLPFVTNFEQQSYVYGIVIDAGSTGTRIHVYKFVYRSENGRQIYDLVEEALEEVRPGLSSFANDSTLARKGLKKLLALARKRVPSHLTRLTHVTLRATAGLRLLTPYQAEALLNEARKCIVSSGFVIDRIEVMDGLEEAVQAWVTVNYLLNQLVSPQHSVGIMDLGGASTQITFVPGVSETLSSVPRDHKHSLNLSGSAVHLYTHSYLELGLMSARMFILSSHNGLQNGDILSPCVPYKYEGHWTHSGVRYSVKSTAAANVSMFDTCYEKSRLLVTEDIPVLHPQELRQRQFYLFSYFYDRVKDAGVSLKGTSNNIITVQDYQQLALDACSPNNSRKFRKPFLCLDLVYIYALLKDGYQFNSSNSFYLSKKINNIELGWSLGVVFDLLYRTELV